MDNFDASKEKLDHGASKRILAGSLVVFITLVVFVSVSVLCLQNKFVYNRRRRQFTQNQTREVPIAIMESQNTGKNQTDSKSSVISSCHRSDTIKTKSLIKCPICLSSLEAGDEVTALPNCAHVFHSLCIRLWTTTNCSCPICRVVVQPLSLMGDGFVGSSGSATPLPPGKMV